MGYTEEDAKDDLKRIPMAWFADFTFADDAPSGDAPEVTIKTPEGFAVKDLHDLEWVMRRYMSVDLDLAALKERKARMIGALDRMIATAESVRAGLDWRFGGELKEFAENYGRGKTCIVDTVYGRLKLNSSKGSFEVLNNEAALEAFPHAHKKYFRVGGLTEEDKIAIQKQDENCGFGVRYHPPMVTPSVKTSASADEESSHDKEGQ